MNQEVQHEFALVDITGERNQIHRCKHCNTPLVWYVREHDTLQEAIAAAVLSECTGPQS